MRSKCRVTLISISTETPLAFSRLIAIGKMLGIGEESGLQLTGEQTRQYAGAGVDAN